MRLHFAETYWDTARARVFDVAVNGQTMLKNFDIFAQADGDGVHGKYIAVARSFLATADANGRITILFTSDVDDAQVNGIEVIPQQNGSVAINAGGGADGAYQADTGSVGGNTFYNASDIDTSLVTDPAPEDVYRSFRYGDHFSYVVSELTPNATELVRLDFVEHYYKRTGQRLINVSINGAPVLSDFDIFAAAGAQDRAIAEYFPATVNGDGTIRIDFCGDGNEALVNAITVSQAVATTKTDASGNYSFSGLVAGTYEVAQAPAAGVRQVAPFDSALQLRQPQSNDQNPRTVVPLYGPNSHPTSVAVADFDGDGIKDIAVLNPTGTSGNRVQILYKGGNGNLLTLAVPGTNLTQLVTGDFYGTGRQDIAVLGTDGTIHILRNEGNGGWDNLGTTWHVSGEVLASSSMVTGRFIGNMGHDQLAVLSKMVTGGVAAWQLDVFYIDNSGNLQDISSPVPGLPWL